MPIVVKPKIFLCEDRLIKGEKTLSGGVADKEMGSAWLDQQGHNVGLLWVRGHLVVDQGRLLKDTVFGQQFFPLCPLLPIVFCFELHQVVLLPLVHLFLRLLSWVCLVPKRGLHFEGLLSLHFEVGNLASKLSQSKSQVLKWLGTPVGTIRKENWHINVFHKALRVVLPEQSPNSGFFDLLDLGTVLLMVDTNLRVPEKDAVDSTVAEPAQLLVIVGLHSPPAATWDVCLQTKHTRNRDVASTCFHGHLTQFGADKSLIHLVHLEGLFQKMRLGNQRPLLNQGQCLFA